MDASVDWNSQGNHILLNPRWPSSDREFLYQEAERVLSEQKISAHLVLTSSGTTAESWRAIKLIFISKAAFLAAADSVVQFFGFNSKDVFAQSLPTFHVGGLGVQARAHLVGARVVPMPAWNQGQCVSWLAENAVSVLSLVPAQIHDVVVAGIKAPSSIRTVFVGAGALSPELDEKAQKLGWPLVATFGMTETSAMVAVRSGNGKGFRPLPGVQAAVTADSLLKIKAPGLATGVLRWTPQGAQWKKIVDSEAWFQTQDQVRIENSEWLILGRENDFVKISGESVNIGALREILSKLLLAQGLSSTDFHLVALPEERTGFEVGLVVQPQGAPSATNVQKGFGDLVLPFERIRRIIELKEIPRTELGKVREEELKQQLMNLMGRPSWKS